MLKHFDFDTYAQLVGLLRRKSANLCFKDFPISDDLSEYFILRHDVDFSPEAALEMAKFESNIGIRATYFILFSSPHYNLLAERHCVFPQRLVELGHEVGLHYDVMAYSQLGSDSLFATLNSEAEMLGCSADSRDKALNLSQCIIPQSAGKILSEILRNSIMLMMIDTQNR